MFQMLHEMRSWTTGTDGPHPHISKTGQRKVMLSTQGTKYYSDAQNDINVEVVDDVLHC